jgi:hypothetical protein
MFLGLGLPLTAFGSKGGAADTPDNAAPAWVLTVTGTPAILDLDFINDRAWIGGAVVAINDVPGLEAARLDEDGLISEAAEPDTLDILTADILGWSEVAATVVTEATAAANASANYALWGATADSENRWVHYRNTSGAMLGIVVRASVSTIGLTGATISNGAAVKTAVGIQVNNCAQSINGAAVQTDVSGLLPANLTTFNVGRDHGTANWEGRIARISLFNVRLPNATLVTLATP